MLDAHVRPLMDPPLNWVGKHLNEIGLKPNHVTLMGFGFGLGAMAAVSLSYYATAFLFLCLNRLLDGLDGAVARHGSMNDHGGFLDILCDFIIYGGIVFAFALNNPENLLSAAFLLFSFIGPITAFLAYAIVAAKRQITTEIRGKKAFYYLGGLCEGTETAIALLLMILFPEYFQVIAWVFGCMCWLTTFGRAKQAMVDFS